MSQLAKMCIPLHTHNPRQARQLSQLSDAPPLTHLNRKKEKRLFLDPRNIREDPPALTFTSEYIPQASASLAKHAGVREEACQSGTTGHGVPGVIKELNCSLLGALGQ